jgi:hypothetical protein
MGSITIWHWIVAIPVFLVPAYFFPFDGPRRM